MCGDQNILASSFATTQTITKSNEPEIAHERSTQTLVAIVHRPRQLPRSLSPPPPSSPSLPSPPPSIPVSTGPLAPMSSPTPSPELPRREGLCRSRTSSNGSSSMEKEPTWMEKYCVWREQQITLSTLSKHRRPTKEATVSSDELSSAWDGCPLCKVA
jgi:hypothetical protein